MRLRETIFIFKHHRNFPGENKECYAYMNEFHVKTKYTQYWQNSSTGCCVKSYGEIIQELWGQPIVVNHLITSQ